MFRLSCLAVMVSVAAAVFADARPTDVYLLIGQSNMAGRGPLNATNRVDATRVLKWNAWDKRGKGDAWVEAVEPIVNDRGAHSGAGPGASFARAMADANPDAVIGLVPCAEGGSPLKRWMPEGDLYRRAVAWTQAALAQGGTLKGILWHQGCTDAENAAPPADYAERLAKMVASLRKDLNAPDVPFVAGELGEYLAGNAAVKHWRTINEQLALATQTIPNMRLVRSHGLADKGDVLHFGMAAQRTLGRRYAAAFLAPDVDSWHGANLLGMFNTAPKKPDPRVTNRFTEDRFRWLASWGFNFARLPMDYRFFLQTNDWTQLKADGFARVDEAVAWGRKYGVHVQLCLHRAPGFTIASWAPEATHLQTEREPQEAFMRIWSEFARRYRGIPNAALSFNLLNEPARFSEEQFIDVFGRTIQAIRAQDPGRFVMLDGNNVASTPVPHFYEDPLTGQAFRGYTPHAISHYGAWYIKDQPATEPTWPLSPEMAKDPKWIYEQPETTFAKYGAPRKIGYPVMVGEFGCYTKISHGTCLKWMEHCLAMWRKNGLGWAIWNVDGAFGFVDSERADVQYEDFEGHKLDRKMLELLRKYARPAVPVVDAPKQGVPFACDPRVMSADYWRIWNADEQKRIDADIEANRKADASFALDVPAGAEVSVEQLDHDFRFGAHIFNFNQLGKTEYNDAYKASYGAGGIFNQATVAFYWNAYEPTPGHLRANGAYEDTEAYWNALTQEQAMLDPIWRRPAAGPVIDFLKANDVAIHGHILVWGSAKPYWIYDWYCPENEKRAFDALGVPRHATFTKRAKAGAEGNYGFAKIWKSAWSRAYGKATEEEIAQMAPTFTANMRRLFRKRVFDVAGAFGDVVDSWDVVNESSRDWAKYRKSRTGLKVWKSEYGLMPGDYPLHALLDAKEAMSPAAKLAINDYNISPDFLEQEKELEAEGAKIDIVGCQMHIFNTNDCMRLALGATDVNWVGTPKVIQDRLDMMAKTGKPLHVSEITITSPGSDARSRQIQAILTRNIYRKWFSHKATMGITWWNTVDGGGVYGEPLVSGLFTRDLKRKPAYDALDELINREWKTRETVKADDQGRVRFRGFRGKYRLSWKDAQGKTVAKDIYVK